ncbi:MAG: PD-(D/E)XK nuclease family protein [Acidobacteriota bacterium]
MSKQIWLAPILSANRQRLIERCADLIAARESDRFLYLTASRPLLELVTRGLLDGERNRGVWGTLPVFLFRGLVRHLLATAVDEQTSFPIAPRIPIDRDELPLKRSLISQVMSRLLAEEKLKALAPLARREGCVNSIATLIGEIQRAAKSPAEFVSIVEARERDFHQNAVEAAESPDTLSRQIDFDREIGLIYSAYQAALDPFRLSEDDADQLRALDVLRGEIDGTQVSVPWLSQVKLLVLDGFFDFTPAQGEMLRFLIPSIPEVIVNVNRDEQNVEIFRPFASTIEQLNSIANFETLIEEQAEPVAGDLAPLRARLFDPSGNELSENESRGVHGGPPLQVDQGHTSDRKLAACATSDGQPSDRKPAACATSDAEESASRITLLECSDRQTEIRAIAKRIKRLVLADGYALADIAVVVRELAAYSEVVTRVFAEENISCSLERRIQLTDVPAVRAALKLFELLTKQAREGGAVKAGELADLVKSGYFRLSESELAGLRERFAEEHSHLLQVTEYRKAPGELNVGEWDADQLENAIAYVGAELRIESWLNRARQLTFRLPEPEPEKPETEDELDTDEESAAEFGQQPAAATRRVERAEPVDVPLPGSQRRPKSAREVHPALIAWSALVVERVAHIIRGAPRQGGPRELRDAMMRMLEQLQFAGEVRGSQHNVADDELSALTLDLRGLEGLRRALAGATKSIEISERTVARVETPSAIKLATLLEETVRCVRAQSLVTGGADPDGLKVLEATDVRGLRFRAVFIAGLVEGGFPLRASRDWIYPHDERNRLKEYGLTLEDISPDTLLKEEHYFYQAACRATERLYLSRPLVLEDGSETVASYYVEELSRAIAPAKISRDTVRSDFDGRSLFESSRGSELATLVVRQEERRRHRAQRADTFPAEVIASLIATACERSFLSETARRRIAIERERGGSSFGRFDGVITSKRLVESLSKQYGLGHDFSASELSLYGKCPFKFFAEKVLRLEPRGEAALDLTALDAGSLLHEALRRFFELHRGERLTGLDRAGLRRELGKVADAVFDEHEHVVPPLNHQVWNIDREIRKLLLEQVLDYEIEAEEKTRARDVRPAYFELAFGMKGGAVDPHSTDRKLDFQRGSGDQAETVRVRGQIDRVDVAHDGSKTAIAYDYKLSKGATLDDMREGRALQLHIYLAALEQLFLPESKIAGAGYYAIKGGDARRNQGLYRKDFAEYTGVRTQTASSLSASEWESVRDEMQARIWEFIDGLRVGQMLVEPSAPEATCPHCDYSAVCRYEKFRIRGKRAPRTED